jgi:hypothetical protein
MWGTPNDWPLWRPFWPCLLQAPRHAGHPRGRDHGVGGPSSRCVDNAPHYLVRLTVLGDERRKLAGLQLVPEMAAEVVVRKGERTLLNHHLCPLEDTIVRAFRE